MQKSLSRYWLFIGTAALAVAGLFSLLLVAARTPRLASQPLFRRLFHEALAVHVDLSVLVWFLAIACMLWSALMQGRRSWVPYLEESALICFALGALAVALAPLDPKGEALMSNYIPVIASPVFFLGLGLIFSGTGLMAVNTLALRGIHAPLRLAALTTLVALIAFVLSFSRMPGVIEGAQYYELGFWGGGHILQFTHVQVMMVCWLLICSALPPAGEGQGGGLLSLGRRQFLFFISPLAGLIGLFGYRHDIASSEHRQFFVDLMIFANGLAPAILAWLILPYVWRARAKNALWSALAASLLLFLYGGVLGGMIQGQNVVIPAHYHGSIVGVTLAFMGAAYLFLPRLGYGDASRWRLAFWQPILYAGGQLMHISGLAWSGGYGVLRKTPGEIADIGLSVKIALGFMGLGGLIAILGGFMFVAVIARAVFLEKPIKYFAETKKLL